MMRENPAWVNAIDCTLPSPFLDDLACAVANEPSKDAAVRWWLSLFGAGDNPWPAWDRTIWLLDMIGDAWPVFRRAAELSDLPDGDTMPRLARFIAERVPGWLEDDTRPIAPVTLALAMAEATHDLFGLFAAGVKATGSHDPFALRRAAKAWLHCCFWASQHRTAAHLFGEGRT